MHQNIKTYRRKLVIGLHKEGNRQSKIAKIIGISQSYVSKILKGFKEFGADFLITKSPTGAPRKLNSIDRNKLEVLLEKGAVSYGFEGNMWTCGRIKRVIYEQFKVDYTQRHVGRILHQMGYTRQKPKIVDYRKDKQKKDTWVKEQLPNLKKKHSKRSEP